MSTIKNVVLVHGSFVDGAGREVPASHAVYVSKPGPVADIIEAAAAA
jgi:hypothetical protein